MKDIGAILEIFRASEMIIHQEELVLEKQNLTTSSFLKQELLRTSTNADHERKKYIGQEVSFLLDFFLKIQL